VGVFSEHSVHIWMEWINQNYIRYRIR